MMHFNIKIRILIQKLFESIVGRRENGKFIARRWILYAHFKPVRA